MNAFHGRGIDTMPMDTYGLVAHGVAAVGGGVTRATCPFLVRDLVVGSWPASGFRPRRGQRNESEAPAYAGPFAAR